jgi:hypothetical protein
MNATAQREEWRALLQRMLACLRRSRETPLQFEIDAAGIVAAALADASALSAAGDARAESSLNELIGEMLGAEESIPFTPETASRQETLAEWLTRFYRPLRAVHPSAIDILAMRLNGFGDREIAERLELGLRLVQHTVAAMRAEWKSEFA